MTLIEIMVVLVILGLIASAIGLNVYRTLVRAKVRTARLDVQALSQAVDSYRMTHSILPESLKDLVPDEVARVRRDPWCDAYVYTHTIDTYEIVSYGPDKEEGGSDDIHGDDDKTP